MLRGGQSFYCLGQFCAFEFPNVKLNNGTPSLVSKLINSSSLTHSTFEPLLEKVSVAWLVLQTRVREFTRDCVTVTVPVSGPFPVSMFSHA